MDKKIVFVKGSNLNYDDSVIEAARIHGPEIRNKYNNQTLEICCGILMGSYGKQWEPIVKLSNKDLVEEEKEIEREQPIYYPSSEADFKVLEMKNDYEDKEFIEIATKVTRMVMIIVLLLKIFLFSRNRILHLNKGLDVLFALSQIIFLGFTIYGYKRKIPSAKYIGLAASILIIITFDIGDVLVGIFYLIFNVDQTYINKSVLKIKEWIQQLKKKKT